VKTEADTGKRRRQVCELAAVERQSLDAFEVDAVAERRRGVVDRGKGAGDRHRLRQFGDLQREVDRSRLRNADAYIGARQRREPRRIDGDLIGSGR
jgi:hypothetical protein